MPAPAVQPAPIQPSPPAQSADDYEARWKCVEKLPCNLSVEARVPGFTLKDLLALEVKAVVRSQLPTSSSPPLLVNGKVVARGDFEVLGKRLAVRLTELA